jgi:hypothetical protein
MSSILLIFAKYGFYYDTFTGYEVGVLSWIRGLFHTETQRRGEEVGRSFNR